MNWDIRYIKNFTWIFIKLSCVTLILVLIVTKIISLFLDRQPLSYLVLMAGPLSWSLFSAHHFIPKCSIIKTNRDDFGVFIKDYIKKNKYRIIKEDYHGIILEPRTIDKIYGRRVEIQFIDDEVILKGATVIIRQIEEGLSLLSS